MNQLIKKKEIDNIIIKNCLFPLYINIYAFGLKNNAIITAKSIVKPMPALVLE